VCLSEGRDSPGCGEKAGCRTRFWVAQRFTAAITGYSQYRLLAAEIRAVRPYSITITSSILSAPASEDL